MSLRIKPSFAQFKLLAGKGNLIPVYTEILADLETPVTSFLKLRGSGNAFLLESVEGRRTQGRYSFVGSEPESTIQTEGDMVKIIRDKRMERRRLKRDPLNELQLLLKKYHYVPNNQLPSFAGGVVGYLAYDAIRFFEKMPKSDKKSPYPESFFFMAQSLVIFDHVERKIKIVANAYTASKKLLQLRKSYEDAVRRIMILKSRLDQKTPESPHAFTSKSGGLKIRCNFTKAKFKKAVQTTKEYIRQGDVIQTVISQRFDMKIRSNSFDVYRALRSINPSPYMFYLGSDDFCLVGSSPEIHVRCEKGKARLRPIAGTRPRSSNARADEKLARDLLADPKERAEHVMLVDLGRNDLGRVCLPGTVHVSQFMAIERYSHVMHLVSQVVGEISPKKSIYDVIRATFPAGTVSGAPKIRAMEIIHELEPSRRGPYAGLVGYFSFSGNLDSCITIRTMTIQRGFVSVQAGAGIVADSSPEKEWQETRSKARGLIHAVELAERGLR